MAKKNANRKLTTQEADYIAPERLYTRDGFMRAAGLSRTRLSDARHDHGLWPKFFSVGIKQYIMGNDAIDFIRELSARMAAAKEAVDKAQS
jgi:hypothetical protein